MDDEFLIVLAVLFALAVVVAGPLLVIVALVRSSRIGTLEKRLVAADKRIAQLESVVGQLARGESLVAPRADMAVPGSVAASPAVLAVESEDVLEPEVVAAVAVPTQRSASNVEQFIGRQALGWTAVVVLLFATAFFVRYAFENQWVGPLGRVAIGVLVGSLMVVRGWSYHRRGWRTFSQMLTAGGIVLVYLSTYAAFGFYQLLPQRTAALFLLLIVAEGGLLALRYNAPAVAVVSVVGGLLTPVLMHSEHDQYASLFLYLGAINAGVVAMLLVRSWSVVGSLAYLGTQWLFWMWYGGNYHPEKLSWALGFQGVLFALYLGHTVLAHGALQRRILWEEIPRIPLVAAISFASVCVLLQDDYRPWLGSLAILMAALYTAVAHRLLARRPQLTIERALPTAALAVATAFIALAFALEARAPWIALGWAAEAGVLWWFGMRVRAWPLRALAAVFAAMAVGRLLSIDTQWHARLPFTPILNDYAIPALAAIACLGLGLYSTRRWIPRLGSGEQMLVGASVVSLLLLVATVVSVDMVNYFDARSDRSPDTDWFRLTQMALSTWWAVYATIILSVGFIARQPLFRWTALALYGLTIVKVFLFDMQGLDELYRIVAFFVLAVVLGLAAWAYQRMQIGRAA